MSVSITASPRTNELFISIENIQKDTRKGLKNALHEIGQSVKTEAKRLIKNGPKTGRTYGKHKASAPWEAPANMTGRLMKSVKFKVRNWHEMTVGAEAEYAGYLEGGTRRMAPRPFLITAVRNKAQDAENTILDCIKREVEK